MSDNLAAGGGADPDDAIDGRDLWDPAGPAPVLVFVDPASGELLDVDPTAPAGLAQILIAQQQALLDLTERLADLPTAMPAGELPAEGDPDGDAPTSTASRKWCWRTMDPCRAETLWGELADWVGWLRSRYPLAHTIPGCWWAHPELVEELTALYRAWLGAVAGGTTGTYTSIEWHDRWLPGTLSRVRVWGADRCATSSTHQPKPPDTYTTTGVDDPDAFTAHVHRDVEGRHTQAPTGTAS